MSPDSELLAFILSRTSSEKPETLARDEAFWTRVREAYARPTDFVHLEYGFYHPTCRAVLEVEIETLRSNQRLGSFYKRNLLEQEFEAARAELAALAGVSPQEIIITRNTTESLNVAIHGIPLCPGDEVIHSNQDYPSIDEAWLQRAERDGVVLRQIQLPLHPSSDEEIVALYEAAITPRSRVLHLTHLIHFTGHVLPVAKLCAMGRRHGLEIIVDAAHSFAHLDFSIRDFDCDYLAASLHKWLGAPLTLGLLFVRKDRVEKMRPLFADVRLPRDDIRKLEHFGNRPDNAHRGLREAIRWHRAISAPVKHARLRHLQRSWTERVRTLPNVHLLTPRDPARHGAIATFGIENIAARDVVTRLFETYKIFVNSIVHPTLQGARVTPGVPTSLSDVEQLGDAIEDLAKR
jgi:selenocysteine lyase/cysteine desulfurase